MADDNAYYTRRAADEWLAVAAADCDEARIAHAELAKWYVQLATTPSNIFMLKLPVRPAMDTGSVNQAKALRS